MTDKRMNDVLFSAFGKAWSGDSKVFAAVYNEAKRARANEKRLEDVSNELRKQVVRAEVERDIWVDRHRQLEKRLS